MRLALPRALDQSTGGERLFGGRRSGQLAQLLLRDDRVLVLAEDVLERLCPFDEGRSAGELGGRGNGRIRLLRAGQKVQAIFARGHQAIEQRSVEAVKIFEGVGHSKAGAEIEVELGVADGSEIDQNYAAMGLLKGDGGVDSGGGGSGAAFGAEKSEDASFAGTAAGTRAVGAETGEGFEERLSAGGIVQKLARSGAHAGHDGGGLLHGAVGENGQLQSVGLNQFDRADGGMRIVGRDIDDHNFGAQILNLTKNRVGGAGRKADVAEYGARQARRLDAALQFR